MVLNEDRTLLKGDHQSAIPGSLGSEFVLDCVILRKAWGKGYQRHKCHSQVSNREARAARPTHPTAPSTAESHLWALASRIRSPSAHSQGFNWLPQ